MEPPAARPAIAPLWAGSFLALAAAAVCAYWVHDRSTIPRGAPEILWMTASGTVWATYALLGIGTAILWRDRPTLALGWRRMLAFYPVVGLALSCVAGAQIPMGAGFVLCWLPTFFLGLVYVLIGLSVSSPPASPPG